MDQERRSLEEDMEYVIDEEVIRLQDVSVSVMKRLSNFDDPKRRGESFEKQLCGANSLSTSALVRTSPSHRYGKIVGIDQLAQKLFLLLLYIKNHSNPYIESLKFCF